MENGSSQNDDAVHQEENDLTLEDLPEVVMIHIYSYLNNNERLMLSQTSQYFNDMFHHPSIWKQMNVDLLDDLDLYMKPQYEGLKDPSLLLNMAHSVGTYLEELSLRLRGILVRPSAECKDIISALMNNSKLRSLVLSVSVLPPKFGPPSPPKLDCLRPVLQLVRSTRLLNRFCVKRWPVVSPDTDILAALRENQATHTLRELSLFYEHPSESGWTPLNPSLPSCDDVLNTIQHFPQLHTLSMRILMTNEHLIIALADLPALRTLRLMIEAPRKDDGSRKLVSVPADAWEQLMKKNSNLQVEFSANGNIPPECLSLALQPTVRLTSFAFMQYAKISSQALFAIADKYRNCLKKFYDYTNTRDLDSALIYLSERCTNLTHVYTRSYIQGSSLLKLAAALSTHGRRVEVLSVAAENILVHEADQPLGDEDEEVLKRREDGSLYFAWQDVVQSDSRRFETITNLRHRVSELLGRPWRPYGCGTDGTIEESELNRVMRGVRLVNPISLNDVEAQEAPKI